MSGDVVLAVIAGQILYTIVVCRAVFRLGREAERQDQQVVACLRGVDVNDEAEKCSETTR